MKNMKKLASVVLALMMAFAMVTNVFAAKITINDGEVTGATYKAWRILNATNDNTDKTKFAYTPNPTYSAALQEVTGTNSDEAAFAALKDLTSNSEAIQNIANALYLKIKSMTPDAIASADGVFADIDQGYYLIAETMVGNNPSAPLGDTLSLVMLDTAGDDDIRVDTKEDFPTVTKEVEEVNDSTGDREWKENADHDIDNEPINYKIDGTLSNKYAYYETYYYQFVDTLSDGLDLNETSIRVSVVNGDAAPVVLTKDTDYTQSYENHILTITFNDLKNISGVMPTSKIRVEYNATLNDSAVIGSVGNPNHVHVEYNRDPYFNGEGEIPKGETPDDTSIVFTYKAIVNKVDEDGESLLGAGFTLYKYDAAVVEENKWVAVGDEKTGGTEFEFKGLDAGTYKLVESTIPEGYNQAPDIEFKVVATYDKDGVKTLVVKDMNDNEISSGDEAQFAVEVADGKVSTTVENNSGVELPSTGGIGTTIFYVVGSLLVVGAAILLITKRRMSFND